MAVHPLLPVLSFFLLLYAAPASRQVNDPCPEGHFQTDSGCRLCPPGTYRPGEASVTECLKCPPGTFSPGKGVVTKEMCRPCYPNTYAPEPGSPICIPCPQNTAARRNAIKCLRCGPGMFISHRGNKCVTCRPGTYSTGSANIKCTRCPLPLSCPAGSKSASACKPCPPGTTAFSYSGGCEECDKGTFKAGTSGTCIRCPPGTISSTYGARKCTPCPKDSVPLKDSEYYCKPCSKKRGFITMAPGAQFCKRAVRKTCESNFFENENGDCSRCPVGSRLDPEKKACIQCPEGSVSKGGLQTFCKKCPSGEMPSNGRDECVCGPGSARQSVNSCAKCPPGTYSNGHEECVECSEGHFSEGFGNRKCKLCPLGTVTTLPSRSTSCMKCPKGLVPEIPGSREFGETARCVSERTGCRPTWRRPETKKDAIVCRQELCTERTPQSEIGKTCISCGLGEIFAKGKCRYCPDDTVSSGGFQRKCTRCKNGMIADYYKGPKCSCDNKVGFGMQAGVCKPCPPGTASTPDSPKCTICPPGTFAEGGRSYCRTCRIDTFTNKAGSSKCKKCPEGTFSDPRTRGTKCVRD